MPATGDGRHVVVTGASTGIGRATALHLDRLGFAVHAGVRRESDGAELAGAALTARRPRTRYLVGRDAKVQAWLAKIVPDRVLDSIIAREIGRTR